MENASLVRLIEHAGVGEALRGQFRFDGGGLARRPDDRQLQTWARGVVLEDGHRTAPAQVRFESTSGKGAWIRIIMGEGRKRQIREIGFLLGLPVVRILRVRIATLELGRLKPRQWRYLSVDEVSDLKKSTKK